MTNNRKRRKWIHYRPDLPRHKDFNIGHWKGFRGIAQLRKCNECGHERETHLTAHKVWCKDTKRSIYCGTMRIVREPVYITKGEEE